MHFVSSYLILTIMQSDTLWCIFLHYQTVIDILVNNTHSQNLSFQACTPFLTWNFLTPVVAQLLLHWAGSKEWLRHVLCKLATH